MIKAKHIEKLELLYFEELSDDDQIEFKEYYKDSQFFIYRGSTYCLDEIMRIDDRVWNGSMGLTNTSALVVRFSCEEGFILAGLCY